MNPANRGKDAALRGLIVLLIVLLVLTLAIGGLFLWADTLYRTALSGRSAAKEEQGAYMTSFDLFAEENEHQTKSRIAGWLSAVSSQEVGISSPRGTLQAMQYEPVGAKENVPWAIVFHGGLGTDREQVLDVACELSLAGYRVLTPDLYAHGSSEGDASTLGFGDAQDVRAWIDYIEKTQMGARIVLFGQDEGAAAVLLAACEGLSESVAAVATDSAFDDGLASALQIAGFEDGSFKSALIAAAYGIRTGMKSETISERIAAAITPLLLIHGTGDQAVPAWQSEDIAAAAGDNARLLFIEGAGHGLSRYVEPKTYYDALLGFYQRALDN